MQIAVLTFDAFNELDPFVAANLLNRLVPERWQAFITAYSKYVRSRNGIVVEAQRPLEFALDADAVIFGSGMKTDDVARDSATLAKLSVDPHKQLLASQCSGALVMAALGLLDGARICSDTSSTDRLKKLGFQVLNKPFHVEGNVATAGGCLSSQYVAFWLIACKLGLARAASVIRSAAPVGEQDFYVGRAIAAVRPYIAQP